MRMDSGSTHMTSFLADDVSVSVLARMTTKNSVKSRDVIVAVCK